MYIGEIRGLAATQAEMNALGARYMILARIPEAAKLPEMKTLAAALARGDHASASRQLVAIEKWWAARSKKNATSQWALTGNLIPGVPNWALYGGMAVLGALAARKFGGKKGR